MIILKETVTNGRLPENIRKQIGEILPAYNDQEIIITIQGGNEVDNTVFKVVPFDELAKFVIEFKEILDKPYHNLSEYDKYEYAAQLDGFRASAGHAEASALWFLGTRKNQIFAETSMEQFSKMSPGSQKEFLLAKSATLHSFCKLIRSQIESADSRIRLIISMNSYAKSMANIPNT